MKVQHVRGRPGYAYLRVQPEPHGVPLLNLKWLAAHAVLDKAMVQCVVASSRRSSAERARLGSRHLSVPTS
jgi:hypothetical protein